MFLLFFFLLSISSLIKSYFSFVSRLFKGSSMWHLSILSELSVANSILHYQVKFLKRFIRSLFFFSVFLISYSLLHSRAFEFANDQNSSCSDSYTCCDTVASSQSDTCCMTNTSISNSFWYGCFCCCCCCC